MPWTSFWCGITKWSGNMTWTNMLQFHYRNMNGSDLTPNTSAKNNQTDTLGTRQLWCFHMDLVLVALLATVSFVANLGLLYLARLTKPLAQATHSSFSMTGPLSPFTIPPQTSNANNNNINNNTMGSGNQTSPTRKSSLPFRRLFCCPASTPSLTDQFYNSLAQQSNTSTGLLRKCSSSVSISRMANGSISSPLGANGRAPRTRRHRRYLKGLLGLSVSNITVAFSLFLWCACHITEDRVYLPWLALLLVANNALTDIAQALEIGAVLWIALERTLGIHWPRERRPSSPNIDQPKTQLKSFGCLRKFICPSWYENKLRQKQTKFALNRSLASARCGSINCVRCSMDCGSCGLGSNLTMRASFHRNLRCVTRVVISLLPLILFLLAAVHSVQSLLQPLVTAQLQRNRTSIFFLTERMLMELQTNPFDERLPAELQSNLSESSTRFVTITYYTNSIVSALVIGQFIAPLAILITTNLLIYRKVAARDKQFFSRQSSNTSKSSFVSSTSTYVSVAPVTPVRKNGIGCSINPVPLLRVLESSNQDLSTCDAQAEGKHSPDTVRTKQPHLLVVPNLENAELPKKESSLELPKPALAQRRCSTPLLQLDGAAKTFEPMSTREADGRKQPFATPQMRRKSSNDVLASLFHGRNSEPSGQGRATEEPLLLQMLRRQHRRTLRILIILLLVFVMCRAPRAIVLMIGWLESRSLCASPKQAYAWLYYTSLWAHTSAVFDTIVYGFWGNRTYRTRLRHWYSRCITYRKHDN